MDDDYTGYYDHESESQNNLARWIIFGFLVVLGFLSLIGFLLTTPIESSLFYVFLFFPMLCFLLFAAFQWARGRDIAPANVSEDEKIFETMHYHALPAEPVGGLDMFRCPDCGLSFEVTNATPVDDKIVLCPFCGTRLFIQ